MASSKNTPTDSKSEKLTVPHLEMESTFFKILLKNGFPEEKAKLCARIFIENSLDGVYTHGVNRFSRFIQYIKNGYINVDASPECKSKSGAIEQWDGNLAPGPLNATQCTERVMELARKNGIGCVALSNTNHWMRGGTYGWKAAKAGFVFIGWTNTLANMPAWGAVDNKIGNNPLVFAVPFQDEAIVLDMAMSQFSYGKVEAYKLRNQDLPFDAGYNKEGKLTKNPEELLESRRVLPAGYWKGAGLSLLLDILATILSGGLSTSEISKNKAEYGVSQVYIAIDLSKLHNSSSIPKIINGIIEDYHNSKPASGTEKISFPGERSLATRKENLEKGIPVNREVWKEIVAL